MDMHRKFLKIMIVVTLITSCLSAISYATPPEQEHIKILFGYRFPPFYTVSSKRSPSNSLRGIFIDVLKKFEKKHPEYIIQYKCLPRARISKVLAEGGGDAFALSSPMFLNNEIVDKYTASSPLWEVGDHLLVKKDSPIAESGLNSLIGKKIAVLHGNGYGLLDEYFSSGLIKKHAVYATSQQLMLVLKGRVDAAICNKSTLPDLIKSSKLSMDDFKIIESPLYTFKLHLLIKSTKKKFIKDFNEFVEKEQLPVIK
ncbi:substrate-binding periplasmic protein [Maridesulfovibrio zosterae]|uniref:substrate-binding periplasmic protein n=1 Tax=Maridesulfovibrio zosterae TaxID=82171 RepID=UPI0003F4F8A4|nr:transporter substrate-binding domain-containing protein [Maridesulfovibrio zosterae]